MKIFIAIFLNYSNILFENGTSRFRCRQTDTHSDKMKLTPSMIAPPTNSNK